MATSILKQSGAIPKARTAAGLYPSQPVERKTKSSPSSTERAENKAMTNANMKATQPQPKPLSINKTDTAYKAWKPLKAKNLTSKGATPPKGADYW